MTAKTAIKIINRRADSIKKLFGAHSDEYELFTTENMTEYDIYTDKNGGLHIRNTAENREQYRQLIAAAKRIQKTPIQVLQRKAKKQRDEWENEFYGESSYTQDDAIKDYDTYIKWYKEFDNYFESCYALATLSGYGGQDGYDYAKELYEDEKAYNTTWNFYYDAGEFDEYKTEYEEQHFYRENKIDPETGEVIPVDNYEYL